MELLRLIPDLTLEQLLFIADRDHVSVSSRISACLVRSDLLRAILERDRSLVPQYVLSGDPLGRNIALEAGIDLHFFPDHLTASYIATEHYNQIREWLRNLGIAERFLADSALMSAVGTIIYERKIPVPEFLSYQDTYMEDALKWIFMMSLANFQKLYHTDDTPQEYLEYAYPQISSPIIGLLNRQTTENLLKLARSIPARGIYFETRAGILDYLYTNIEYNSALSFFRQINKEYYPGREHLIQEFVQSKFRGNFISSRFDFKEIPNPYVTGVISGSEKILSLPPFSFEEKYCQIALNTEGRHEDFIQAFPVLAYLTEMDWNDPFASEIVFAALQSDPRIQPRTGAEMAQLYGTRHWLRLSPEVVYRLTGQANIKTYIKIFQFGPYEIQFSLRLDTSLCPNSQDIYLNPHQGFVITYGNLVDFVCYSPEELVESFQVSPEFVAFRKPNRPQEVFSNEDVEELLDNLETQNPVYIPGYRDRVQPLINKIKSGLAAAFEIDLDSVTEKFDELSDEDRILAERIFRDFFSAGMFQRTWDGVGPYPMRYQETQGSCLSDIEIKMTPLLNDIRESYDRLSPEGKAILNGLSVIDYQDGIFIKHSDPLMGFEAQTREGNFCVGYGSSLMIYSGYFYLSALEVEIPGFDINLFDPNSTHR